MRFSTVAALCMLMFLACQAAAQAAGDQHCACQSCQAADGCCYHDVVKYRCVMVPDKKQIKKTVFECRDVPYCEHRLPKFGHCDCCPECAACPKFKKVLVKKEIVVSEVCVMKCVVEEYCERVLGPCCHCGHMPQPAAEGVPQDAPGVPPPPSPPEETKSAWLPPVVLDDPAPVRR